MENGQTNVPAVSKGSMARTRARAGQMRGQDCGMGLGARGVCVKALALARARARARAITS